MDLRVDESISKAGENKFERVFRRVLKVCSEENSGPDNSSFENQIRYCPDFAIIFRQISWIGNWRSPITAVLGVTTVLLISKHFFI